MAEASSQHPTTGRKGIAMKGPAASPYVHPTVSGKGPAAPVYVHPVVAGKRLPPPLSAEPPAPKRAKKTTEDATLVAPLPVIAFIKTKTRRKACGKCKECKKPVCGKCKACILNAKGSEKRRCEVLRCLKLPEDTAPVLPKALPGQAPIPPTVEGIAAELSENASELAKLAGVRTHDHEAKAAYKALLARKAALHSAQVSLRNIRSRRKSRFPVGFPEAWGIINKLEKTRAKFAEYVVRQSPGNNSAAVERKRQKRDTLDRTISEYCSLWSEELCPVDDADADRFWKLIGKPRETAESSSDEYSEEEEDEEEDDHFASSDSGSDMDE